MIKRKIKGVKKNKDKLLKLFNEKKYEQALPILEAILKIEKDFLKGWYLFAVIHYRLMNYALSLEGFEKSSKDWEANALWCLDFGNLLTKLHRYDEAEEQFERSLQFTDRAKVLGSACNSLAFIYQTREKYDRAIDYFQKAMQYIPEDYSVPHNLGLLFSSKQNFVGAVLSFEKAVSLYERKNKQIAIAFRCHLASARYSIKSEKQLLDKPSAEAYLVPAIFKEVGFSEYSLSASIFACFLLQRSSSWEAVETAMKRYVELSEKKNSKLASAFPFYTLSLPPFSEKEHMHFAKNWVAYRYDNELEKFEHRLPKQLDRPVNVGLMSSDLGKIHPVSQVLSRLLMMLDKSVAINLMIFSTSQGALTGKKAERLNSLGVDWYAVAKLNDKEIAQEIYKKEVDILIDLNGYTTGDRYQVFQYNPAPVAVNWLGYPGTLGGDSHDWILADKYVIPKTSEDSFTESVWRLPVTYFPVDDSREIILNTSREDVGLPEVGVIFAGFSNSYKINCGVFDSWCEILRSVPNSILWLRDYRDTNQSNLLDEAQKRGVNKERIFFAEHLDSIDEHWGRMGLVDLALDTWPYNMHATAVDFLSAGVPVLTIKGDSFASRVGESLMNAVNMPDMVAENSSDFIRRAIEAVHSSNKLVELKARIKKARAEAPLFDSQQMAKELEKAFIGMYQSTTGVEVLCRDTKKEMYLNAENKNKMTIKSALEKALMLEKEGKSNEALKYCRGVLSHNSEHSGALYLMGVLNLNIFEYKESLKYFNDTRKKLSHTAAWQFQYGRLLDGLGRGEEAGSAIEKAIEINPQISEFWAYLGKRFEKRGNNHKAIDCYVEAEKLEPGNVALLYYLGISNAKIKNRKKACRYFSVALENIEVGQESNKEFLIRYNYALQLYHGMSSEKALSMLQPLVEYIDYSLDHSEAGSALAFILYMKYLEFDWYKLEYLRRLLEYFLYEKNQSIEPFQGLFLPDLTSQDHFLIAERFWNTKKNFPYVELENKVQNRSMHIGVLSSDLFSDHPVHHVSINLFEWLSQKGVKLSLFSLQPISSTKHPQISKRVRECFDSVIGLYSLASEEAADIIYNQKTSVLIDMIGHTRGRRHEILLRRPSSIIVNWLGFPGTMGGFVHDWIIGDDHVTPKFDESSFSERIWRMPYTYFPVNNQRKISFIPDKVAVGLPENIFIFSVFSNSYKINPSVLDAWCSILRKVPDSILWMKSSGERINENLKNEFFRRGIMPERLVFSPRLDSIDDHLSRLSLADLALDTWPYNMHATSVDFLTAGVPVVTVKGEAFAGRVGESILYAAGLPDLVQENPSKYIERAVELAMMPEKLELLKQRVLKCQSDSMLFNTERMADDFILALYGMINHNGC